MRFRVALLLVVLVADGCSRGQVDGVLHTCDVPTCFVSHGYDDFCVGPGTPSLQSKVDAYLARCRAGGPGPLGPGCSADRCFVTNCRPVGECCAGNC